MAGDPGSVSGRYRIVVRGEIRPDVLSQGGGLSVESTGPTSVLLLAPRDHHALQAALGWLRDADIEVLSLMQVKDEA